MKNEQVEIGMLVAVNDLPDGTLYRVAGKTGKFTFELTYELKDGRTRQSGEWDCSMFRKPTRAQIQNWKKFTGRK